MPLMCGGRALWQGRAATDGAPAAQQAESKPGEELHRRAVFMNTSTHHPGEGAVCGHSRTCPLDASASPSSDDQRESACPAYATAKTQQATRKKWTRARAKGPSRETERAQRSSDTEGSSDEPW